RHQAVGRAAPADAGGVPRRVRAGSADREHEPVRRSAGHGVAPGAVRPDEGAGRGHGARFLPARSGRRDPDTAGGGRHAPVPGLPGLQRQPDDRRLTAQAPVPGGCTLGPGGVVELIVEDAVVVTMGAGAGPADSMLVGEGRVAAVGQAETVRAAAPGAEVVRLGGATVIPGPIDAPWHVADLGYLSTAPHCGQPSAPGIAAIQARLRQAAERAPDGTWVTGAGYAEYKLREGRHPTRTELDEAVPTRPAVLYHTSLHVFVLNTAALQEAGFADGQ